MLEFIKVTKYYDTCKSTKNNVKIISWPKNTQRGKSIVHFYWILMQNHFKAVKGVV